MKRAFMAAALTAGALLADGGVVAASASATPVASTAYVAGPIAGSSSAGLTANERPAILNAPQAKAQGALQERRRTRTTRKKSGIGRFFGALAFLFIGLPLLIIAALVIFFMVRSSRKRREREMAQMNNQQFNNGFNNQGPRY